MFDSNAMSKLSDPSAIPDLDQRLGLYRVFLKLYEHHRELLDEILDLENSDRSKLASSWQFVQGVIQNNQIYLTTNLLSDKTQMLIQPQHCWIIGRDRKSGLPILDKRLSRRHAVMQYVNGEGFYLIDLNSTNGSFINGEPVCRPTLLRDGDRIRLGSLSFIFFLCEGVRQVEAVSDTILKELGVNRLMAPPVAAQAASDPDGKGEENSPVPLEGYERETFAFLNPPDPAQEDNPESLLPDLSSAHKADILDRFLNRS